MSGKPLDDFIFESFNINLYDVWERHFTGIKQTLSGTDFNETIQHSFLGTDSTCGPQLVRTLLKCKPPVLSPQTELKQLDVLNF